MAHTDQPGVHHETSDANVGGVTRLLAITIGFLVVSFAFVAWTFTSFRSSSEAGDVKPAPITQRTGDRQPPAPRLQTTPVVDLKAFRASEQQVLDTYAWVDQANGVVRMPIASAIEHVAKNGLPKPIPAPAAVTPSPDAGTTPQATPTAPPAPTVPAAPGAAAAKPAASPVH